MRRKHREEEEAGVDMTPMLDIVFIMLIFFIVTTSFVKESGLDLNRPSASKNQQEQDTQNAPMVIRISATDEITTGGRIIDPRRVTANVEAKSAGNSKLVVLVNADPDASAEALLQVADGVKAAGITPTITNPNK